MFCAYPSLRFMTHPAHRQNGADHIPIQPFGRCNKLTNKLNKNKCTFSVIMWETTRLSGDSFWVSTSDGVFGDLIPLLNPPGFTTNH